MPRPMAVMAQPPQNRLMSPSPMRRLAKAEANMMATPITPMISPAFIISSPLFPSCVNELVRFTFKYSSTSI